MTAEKESCRGRDLAGVPARSWTRSGPRLGQMPLRCHQGVERSAVLLMQLRCHQGVERCAVLLRPLRCHQGVERSAVLLEVTGVSEGRRERESVVSVRCWTVKWPLKQRDILIGQAVNICMAKATRTLAGREDACQQCVCVCVSVCV